MSSFYEFVGRVAVSALITRYRDELRVGGILAVAASILGLGAYLATREHDDAAS